MSLRNFLTALPVVAILVAACADQENPSGTNPGDDGEKPGDQEPNPNDDGDPTDPSNGGKRGFCKVSTPGDAGKVIKATLLLPESVVEGGEVFIDKTGVIACAAKSCSSTAGYASATKIDCTDAVVSPGLINPHDHISFANNPPHKPTQERYEHRHDWRKGYRQHTKISTGAKSVANAVDAAELRFVMSGVTAIAGAGGVAGLVRNVDGSPALFEDGLRMATADSDTFPLADGSSSTFPTTCDGFPAKRRTAASIANLKGYLPHISEGIDHSAHAEFVCQSNANQDDAAHDLIERQTAVVHGMAVNPADVARYRSDLSILVWSPRSNVDLYGNTAPVALYDNLGVPIALGTDWLPSGSMNMSRELRCADELNTKYFGNKLSDKQLWQAVTINAAFAVGASHALGQLKPGYTGDIAIFDGTAKKNAYRAVIEAGVEDTILVLRGGKALYGDANIVKEESAGGGADCEDITVCKVAKKACVKKDLGKKTLADLQTAADAVYPLFFCKDEVPTNEPSCLPARGPTAGQPKVSVYSAIAAGDKDGDGVPDASDNCPDVFNPIRPMDSEKQADADGDGIGDACDKCPLESGESCTLPSAGDMDGDGVPNGTDNCPEDANPDQTDADGDGKGAACDKDGAGNSCDDRKNPGSQACPSVFTIAQLRNASAPGHPKSGDTRAIVRDVWVTAVKDVGSGTNGFFIQEAGTQYTGMFVATPGSKPTVKVGNKVDVEGDYEELFGLSQLSNAKVDVKDSGTTLGITPVVIDPAVYASTANKGAAGEPWETMLCVVNGPVSVSMQNADTNGDYDEFAVTTSNLRVDDYIYDALDNNYAVGTTFQKIVGICGYAYDNRKIWPRNAADITQ
ncbi:MAG: amidohydrolase family protein [Myxococcales bacterium]|nr:amidohydrolase family protein [Myxococcales bacterium]